MGLIRRADAVAGPVTAVAVTTVRISNLRELVVTAVSDGDGDLRLIGWEISADGGIRRRGSATAGAIGELQVLAVPPPGGTDPLAVVTTVRAADGELQHLGWRVDEDGQITRGGDAAAGPVETLATTLVSNSGKLFMTTAAGDGTHDLELIVWEVNPK